MTNLLLLGFLPSGSEWIIIALVILLLFGGKKIPELIDAWFGQRSEELQGWCE